MNKSLYKILITLCLSVNFLSLSAIPKHRRRKNTYTHQAAAVHKARLNKRKKAAHNNGRAAIQPKKALRRNKKAIPRRAALRSVAHKRALNENRDVVFNKKAQPLKQNTPKQQALPKQPRKGILKTNNTAPKKGPAKTVRFSPENEYRVIEPNS